MEIILMRGLPGSGKSTFVKQLSFDKKTVICSADKYHYGVDGIYRFDPLNIRKAHNQCLAEYLTTLMDSDHPDLLVVDNTNLAAWELAPYYQLAQLCDLPVRIIRIHTPFEECVRRQTHNVPLDKLWQMYQILQTERLPPHWKEDIIL